MMNVERWWRSLYAQVLAAIFFGGVLGHFAPDIAVQLKPLGDAFIKLVKMVIGPVIFLTVAGGIAGMSSLARLGSTTGKAMIYFFVVSTFALVIGLVVANLVRPGAGMNVDPETLDSAAVGNYVGKADEQTIIITVSNLCGVAALISSLLSLNELLPIPTSR